MRPGYLGDLSDCWFGQVEDKYMLPGEQINYVDTHGKGLPPDIEVGYIPEYMRMATQFPNTITGSAGQFIPGTVLPGPDYYPGMPPNYRAPAYPRPVVRLRPTRTFNVLMV